MTCTAHIFGHVDGLQCVREDVHETGHVFVSTSGVPDRHEATSGGEG